MLRRMIQPVSQSPFAYLFPESDTTSPSPTDDEPAFWIEYSENVRRILLNGQKQLARPHSCSENELVFSYLYQHAYRRITLKELEEKATGQPLNKNLHEILRDLGFKSALARIFFDVSKLHIRFRRSVSYAQLAEFGVDEEEIERNYLS